MSVAGFVEAKRIGARHTGRRTASEGTLAEYEAILGGVEREIGKPLDAFGPEDATATLRAAQRLAPSTRNKRVTVLRQYFEWAARTGLVDDNWFDGVRQAKVPDRLPRALPMTEVDRIVAAVAEVTWGPLVPKYQAAFLLQATSGLRLGEVRTLRIADLGEDGLTVRGKGEKLRWVPLRPDVAARLRALAEGRRPENYLFANLAEVHGGDGGTKPMSGSSFSRVFKAAAVAAGVEKATPHSLRHSFATHALRQTGRLEVVQDFLGHADPKTTRVYARLTNNDLRQAHQRLW